jgi:hypothetical protein
VYLLSSISKLSTPLLSIYVTRMMYFLCRTGTPFSRNCRDLQLSTSATDSNFSAYSSVSPPILRKYLSTCHSSTYHIPGALKLSPGGGEIGGIHVTRSLGDLILSRMNPQSDTSEHLLEVEWLDLMLTRCVRSSLFSGKLFPSAADAVADFSTGSTLAVGGF